MSEEKIKNPRPAYMVDVDESTGKQVRGTVRSATKEKPKLSQRDSRPGKSSRKSHSDTGIYPGENCASHSHKVEVATAKEGILERRKSVSESVKSPRKTTKPPVAHGNRSLPKILVPRPYRDDPSHFGISTPTYNTPVVSQPPAPMQIPLQPRALTAHTFPRPTSYHQLHTSTGGYGPPLSMSAYYTQPVIAPSYPPPSPYAMPQQPRAPQVDYFTAQPHLPAHVAAPMARSLSARFDSVPRSAQVNDPIPRTTSAYGVRDTRRVSISEPYEDVYYDDNYSRASDGQIRRRESIRGPPVRKEDADYMAMPPPPRPAGILRRPIVDRPPERQDDRDYRDCRESRDDKPLARYRNDPSPRRPSTNRNSVSYDLGRDSEKVRVETANNSRRRQSYYGQSASTGSSGYDDKYTAALNQATSYQENVGGPAVPLTAESLRKQQKRQAGSSRSTKSSGSRDESEYRKSATTRTTRSGSGNDDENVTIKISGQARVVVGGAQIDCGEGGEIRIERHQSLRGGSERSNSEYGGQRQIDDRRSRIEGRSSGRTRLSSENSYTRTAPPYDNYI